MDHDTTTPSGRLALAAMLSAVVAALLGIAVILLPFTELNRQALPTAFEMAVLLFLAAVAIVSMAMAARRPRLAGGAICMLAICASLIIIATGPIAMPSILP